MALDLKNLDDTTRKFMAQELQADITAGEVYHSKFLTDEGRTQWNNVLLEAVQNHDSTWLAEKLVSDDLAVSEYKMTDKNGVERRVTLEPSSLADSEFNRYYIRGVCLRAIDEGVSEVVTYRAKPAANPVSESDLRLNPRKLLLDLRSNKGETVLDVPSNPNSGISVMLPEAKV
jgi:hypothetical protein